MVRQYPLTFIDTNSKNLSRCCFQGSSNALDGDGHVMFLMRGVPGSGKSTIVKHLMKMFHTDSICSADQYFSRNGRYRFDQKQLKQAHEYCHEKGE